MAGEDEKSGLESEEAVNDLINELRMENWLMIVLIDTNILISVALNPNGTPFKAYVKAVSYPNQAIICEQNIDELRRIFNRKFSNNLQTKQIIIQLTEEK